MQNETRPPVKWTKKRVVKAVVLTPVLLLLMFWFGRQEVYLIQDLQMPDTSMDDYLIRKRSGLPVEDPYFIFPDKVTAMQANSQDYFYRYDHQLLFDDDMIVYLKCVYTEVQYRDELERLERLCGPVDLSACEVPAFVPWEKCAIPYKTYALPDEETHTIIYIACQGHVFLREYYPDLPEPNLLPQKPAP